MNAIARLFGRSPFGPTVEHMRRVMTCVDELPALFAAVVAEDLVARDAVLARIDELEALADEAKHEIRNHLPKAVFLPIDRRDLLEIVHLQDAMADSLQEAAGLLTLKPLPVPVELRDELRIFAAQIHTECRRLAGIMEHLDELVESIFGGPEAEVVLGLIEELGQAENKSELLSRKLARRLFALGDALPPVDTMLWLRIIETTAEIANNAERTASRLRLLIARG